MENKDFHRGHGGHRVKKEADMLRTFESIFPVFPVLSVAILSS